MLSGRDKSAATVWVGFTRLDPSDADDEDAGAQKTRLMVAGHEEMISATSLSMAFTWLQGVYHPPEPPRAAGAGANRSSQSSRRTCSGIFHATVGGPFGERDLADQPGFGLARAASIPGRNRSGERAGLTL